MESSWKRWGWPVVKGLLAVAILAAVGRQFYRDLARPELDEIRLRPGWLVASAGLYLAGLSLSAGFWHRLLHTFGDRPALFTAVRAYFIGHLGKYVPGKAWALMLRGGLVRGPDVRLGVAIIASFYEVLTTMAAGALVAAVVFVVDPPDVPGLAWHPMLTGLLLLGLCGVPLLPGVFNRMVGKAAARFRQVDAFQLPRLGMGTLALGLGMTAVGWGLLGLSAWATLQGVLPDPPGLTLATWAQLTGSIGLAYVAGFLAVVLPGGVGVREYFLLTLWGFLGVAEPLIAAAVILLRLVWTAAELACALVVLPLGPRKIEVADPSPPGIE